VRVQALEAAAPRAAADPHRQLRPETLLLGIRCAQTRLQISFLLGACTPALDASGCLDARDRRHEMWARQPERGRKRIAVFIVRRLLGNRRAAEGTADGYAAERPRRATQLTLDDGAVIHHRPR
jgi:hypothetical protein